MFAEVLLPEFMEDPERNKHKIALLLATLDSRKLPTPIRVKLGLTPTFQRGVSDIHKPPRRPPISSMVQYQCSLAEDYAIANNELLEQNLPPSFYEVSIEFFRCLVGKINGFLSGLCFETTEFSNGYVMLKDVWYLPLWKEKRNYALRKQLGKYTEQSLAMRTNTYNQRLGGPFNYDILYQGNQDPVVTPVFIRWDSPGGVWAPTRALFQRSDTLR